MTISFKCPECQSAMSTADSNAGRQAKCPQCQAKIRVPGVIRTADEVRAPLPPPLPHAHKSSREDRGDFEVVGDNIRIIGEPDASDPGFAEALSEAVRQICQRGAILMQLDFSMSQYRQGNNRLPIVSIAKNALRPFRTQLQISLTGFWQ
jgi:DNA-directed RNA polymerase subunit RPC12/RpoP